MLITSEHQSCGCRQDLAPNLKARMTRERNLSSSIVVLMLILPAAKAYLTTKNEAPDNDRKILGRNTIKVR
ncbi:hypothetical protein VTO42DRAFT_1457 [Malbranchea cinnamomea]